MLMALRFEPSRFFLKGKVTQKQTKNFLKITKCLGNLFLFLGKKDLVGGEVRYQNPTPIYLYIFIWIYNGGGGGGGVVFS